MGGLVFGLLAPRFSTNVRPGQPSFWLQRSAIICSRVSWTSLLPGKMIDVVYISTFNPLSRLPLAFACFSKTKRQFLMVPFLIQLSIVRTNVTPDCSERLLDGNLSMMTKWAFTLLVGELKAKNVVMVRAFTDMRANLFGIVEGSKPFKVPVCTPYQQSPKQKACIFGFPSFRFCGQTYLALRSHCWI